MKPAFNRKPDPCSGPFKAYPNEDQRATIESHCHAQGISISGFLIREGVRAATAHQQINRPVARDQGPVTGLRRALSFPGVRRASRGALRPMRS